MKYLVILIGQKGEPIPMMDMEDVRAGGVALFDKTREADAAARANLLGGSFGYEVVEWPHSTEE